MKLGLRKTLKPRGSLPTSSGDEHLRNRNYYSHRGDLDRPQTALSVGRSACKSIVRPLHPALASGRVSEAFEMIRQNSISIVTNPGLKILLILYQSFDVLFDQAIHRAVTFVDQCSTNSANVTRISSIPSTSPFPQVESAVSLKKPAPAFSRNNPLPQTPRSPK